MQTFQLNGQSVRFSQAGDSTYLITSDANKAFGFKGENTLLDIPSVRLDSLTECRKPMLSTENLAKNTLVIELKNLLLAILRSNKSEMENMQDILSQQLAKAFAQNFGMQANQPMLAPISDTHRIAQLATASAARHQKGSDDAPANKIDLPGWLTVTEMLISAGEDENEETGLLKNDFFRFWINRQMSDVYRAQHGEEPPTVSRKKGKGYCYPPSFIGLVNLYRSNWLLDQG